MTDRDRFVACILGEPVDRPPFWLYWEPWPSAWQRWIDEGKPENVIDARIPFEPDWPPLPVPVNCGPCPPFEQCVLEEDDHAIVYIDSWGIKRRTLKHAESMPQFLEFPVKSRRDWEQYREERLNPDNPDRLSGDWKDAALSWAQSGIPVQLGCFPDVGLFGGLRWLLGDEECLVAFCTQPDLVHEIMDHLTSLYLAVFEKVAREVRVDIIHMWEDMCSRHGPLISPPQWDAFLGPNYRRIKAFAKAHNIPVFSVDTDGRPHLIVPQMINAGVNFLWPMEVAAGCDINAIQADFPTLGLMGGIDKRVLAQGCEAIDRELNRIRPAVERGRYIPDLDHLIPDDVPWRNYQHYAQSLKCLVGK